MRESAGLSQARVAAAVGVSRAAYGQIERGRLRDIGIRRSTLIAAVLGADLSVRLYPAAAPLRDAGHVALLEKFERRLAPAWRVTHEAGMPIAGDRRAWDRRLEGPVSIGVEAETRPRDVQALERSMNLKQRDSGVTRMLLVLPRTRRNADLLRAALPALRSTFPLSTGEVLRALATGRDPGANGVVVI